MDASLESTTPSLDTKAANVARHLTPLRLDTVHEISSPQVSHKVAAGDAACPLRKRASDPRAAIEYHKKVKVFHYGLCFFCNV